MAKALKNIIKLCSEYSLPLIIGVFVALIFANIFPHTYHDIVHHKFIDGKYWSTLHFFVNELPIKELPPVMHTKKGIWLIGYNGSIKAYSEDTRILISLFELIDSTPMRREQLSCR